jgi:hypothetical protein
MDPTSQTPHNSPRNRLEICCKIDGPPRKGAIVCFCRESRKSPIVYFGMNQTAYGEVAVVKRGNANKGGVTAIINADQKTMELTHQLANCDQVKKLIAEWCLPEKQGNALVDLIEQTVWGRGKALLFRLAEIYAQAETGCRRMERVLLSGECFGSGLFSREHDTTPVTLDFDDFVKLRSIFPVAAGQVKHLLVAACSSGFRGNIPIYRKMYPNVQTIMAYASKAPAGWIAYKDITHWESNTDKRKHKTLAFIPKRMDPKYPDGEHWIKVATWSIREGYGVDEEPLSKLLGRVKSMEPEFMACMTGADEPNRNPERGIAHDYFRLLIELAYREDYDDKTGRSKYAVQLEQAKRLRYWARIRVRFGNEYEERLRKGFQAARLDIPDFKEMTRAELIAHIAQLKAAEKSGKVCDVGMAVADVLAALRLLRGLYELDSTTIPKEWLE